MGFKDFNNDMESITIFLEEDNGESKSLEIPLGVSLSLMEVLKGEGYPIEATCGGMALCATCRMEVLNQKELGIDCINDDELAMLENLPCYTGKCRLTCQIKISEELNGLRIKFPIEIPAWLQ